MFAFRYVSLFILGCIMLNRVDGASWLSDPPIMTQASQSGKIKELWEEKSKNLNKRTKNYPRNKIDLLCELLKQVSTDEVKIEFERVRNSPVDYAAMSDYDQTLVQAFVEEAVKRKESQRLTYLLTGKCPRYIGSVPIELYLSIISARNILVLLDSYDKSTNEDAKKTIMSALGAVFRTLRQRYENDQQFVQASKEWYLDNQYRVKVNPYYNPRSYGPITGDFFLPKRRVKSR